MIYELPEMSVFLENSDLKGILECIDNAKKDMKEYPTRIWINDAEKIQIGGCLYDHDMKKSFGFVPYQGCDYYRFSYSGYIWGLKICQRDHHSKYIYLSD